MADNRKIIIGVIGAGKCSKELKEQAQAVGRAVAGAGAILVTGGLGGVMEGAAEGARKAGGLTIGIIPSADRTDANPYCDIVIPTGMGEARNVIVVQTSDALVALHGKYGTITEICFALKHGKPVVSLVRWDMLPEVVTIPDPANAVAKAIDLVRHVQQ